MRKNSVAGLVMTTSCEDLAGELRRQQNACQRHPKGIMFMRSRRKVELPGSLKHFLILSVVIMGASMVARATTFERGSLIKTNRVIPVL
jgi:hypothetical protein